jgi:hypothetical protein
MIITAYQLDNMVAGLFIKIAGRLVGKQKRWILCKGSRECHALLLTPRKLAGLMVNAMDKT